MLVVKSKQSTERTQRGSDNKGQTNLLIKDCKYCGRDHAKGRCSAYNKSCNKCQTIGHFAKACKKSQNVKQVNQVEVPQGDSSEEGDTFHVNVVTNGRGSNPGVEGSISCNKWTLDFLIEGETLQARVDTGAEVSTMSRDRLIQLGFSEITKTKAKLSGYGDKSIPVLGYAKLPVIVPSGKTALVKFYITDNQNQTLLGMPAIVDLELLKVRVNQVSKQKVFRQNILDKYPDVFTGLGKFGDQVSLQLKSSAEPRSLTPRLIPHKKRTKLKTEIDRLVESGVIIKDVSPTQWLSPIVLVNKPNSDLRICLDPQFLNSQLIRAQCAIPILSEIFS